MQAPWLLIWVCELLCVLFCYFWRSCCCGIFHLSATYCLSSQSSTRFSRSVMNLVSDVGSVMMWASSWSSSWLAIPTSTQPQNHWPTVCLACKMFYGRNCGNIYLVLLVTVEITWPDTSSSLTMHTFLMVMSNMPSNSKQEKKTVLLQLIILYFVTSVRKITNTMTLLCFCYLELKFELNI